MFSKTDGCPDSETAALFAEAIRAREQQQSRVRAALEEQNRRLCARLDVCEKASFSCGVGEAESSTAEVQQHKSSGKSRSLSFSPKRKNAVPVEEFINFVTEMKELVSDAYRADLTVLYALQDHVDFQNRELTQRIAGLEAQMIAMQRREEFGRGTDESFPALLARFSNQTMEEKPVTQYVLSELQNVQDTSAETTARVCRLDNTLERVQTSVCLLEKDLNVLEAKIVNLETIPSVHKQYVIAMDERFTKFTQQVQEEISQQGQQLMRNMFNADVQRAEKSHAVEDNVTKFKGGEVDKDEELMYRNLSSLVEIKVQQMRMVLESFLGAKIDELKALHSAAAGAIGQEKNSGNETILTSCGVDKKVADDMPAVTNKYRTQPATFNELYVDVRKGRLESEIAVFSDDARNTANCAEFLPVDVDVLSGDEMVVERLGVIEAKVQKMEKRLNGFFASLPPAKCAEKEDDWDGSRPKMKSFFVDMSGCKNNGEAVDMSAACGQLSRHNCCQLQEEKKGEKTNLEMIAASFSLNAAEKLERAYNLVSGNTAREINSVDECSLVPSFTHTRPKFTSFLSSKTQEKEGEEQKKVQQGEKTSSPAPPPQVFAPFKAPPLLISQEDVSKTIAGIHARKRQKEEAVTKIIASLRNIQKCFCNLLEREVLCKRESFCRDGKERLSSTQREHSVDILDSIVSKKEALYAKEKQLLGLRNTLWLEIAQLEEEEQEILTSF